MGIELGQTIDGKYRVIDAIGEGGMGAVYAGEHLKLHRKVAIKVLKADVANDPDAVARFEREAQAAGRIGNDHILEVFDIGKLPDGAHYMVMEFLDGEPLSARLKGAKRHSPRHFYPLARQILEGLAAAHAAGIVHRDLKPANIFVLREKAGARDYVKLIDFGISKFQMLAGEGQQNQTQTGTIIGTPRYMSPEQARGLREADARSDLYALGVIIYEAITGRCPFEGESINDILYKLFRDEPPPSMASLMETPDSAFNSIVMKALEKNPNDRFPRAEDFLAALDAWSQSGQGVPSKSPASATASMGLPHTLRDRPSPAQTSTAPEQPALPPEFDAGLSPRTLPGTERSWAGAAPVQAPSISVSPPAKRSSPILIGLIGVTALVGIGAGVVAVRASAKRDGSAAVAASAAPQHADAPTVPKLAEALQEPLPGLGSKSDASGAAAPTTASVSATPQAEPPVSSKSGPAQTNQPKAPATHAGSKASKLNCEPPYYLDSHGARVFKEQCL